MRDRHPAHRRALLTRVLCCTEYRMSRYGVSPNMMVMPPQMLLYMALAPEAKLTRVPLPGAPLRAPASRARRVPLRRYKEGGPAAAAAFEAGVAGVEARAFRGCGVFTSEPVRSHAIEPRASAPFAPSPQPPLPLACAVRGLGRPGTRRADQASRRATTEWSVSPVVQDSVQMLTRSTQVGEFYVMQPPQTYPGAGRTEFSCDLLLYDEESDRHVRISWKDAMAACCIAGTLDRIGGAAVVVVDADATIPANINLVGGLTTDQWRQAAEKISAFNMGRKATDGAAGETTADEYTANVNKDIRIVVARPFIEHLMHSVILCVSGRDTGATLFGPADMCAQSPSRLRGLCPSRPFLLRRAGNSRPTHRSRPSKVTVSCAPATGGT